MSPANCEVLLREVLPKPAAARRVARAKARQPATSSSG